ncbi:MAG: acyltransferase [Hyphomicrobiales bacterium]
MSARLAVQRGVGSRGRDDRLPASLASIRRYGLKPTLRGLLLRPRFTSAKLITCHGGRPLARIQNRGTLKADVLLLSEGVHIEVHAGATLTIGKGTFVNRHATVNCAESITIGQYCSISWNTTIIDSDQHDPPGRSRTAPIVIGDHVLIGCGAIILKGVTIGDYAVVGAGAVVTRDVPAGAVVAGDPARPIAATGDARPGSPTPARPGKVQGRCEESAP